MCVRVFLCYFCCCCSSFMPNKSASWMKYIDFDGVFFFTPALVPHFLSSVRLLQFCRSTRTILLRWIYGIVQAYRICFCFVSSFHPAHIDNVYYILICTIPFRIMSIIPSTSSSSSSARSFGCFFFSLYRYSLCCVVRFICRAPCNYSTICAEYTAYIRVSPKM